MVDSVCRFCCCFSNPCPTLLVQCREHSQRKVLYRLYIIVEPFFLHSFTWCCYDYFIFAVDGVESLSSFRDNIRNGKIMEEHQQAVVLICLNITSWWAARGNICTVAKKRLLFAIISILLYVCSFPRDCAMPITIIPCQKRIPISSLGWYYVSTYKINGVGDGHDSSL